ncbi:MAG: dienelactone hydrolase family protein [Acidimicrobiales bacterium]
MKTVADETTKGARRREFAVDADGRVVPGALWTPLEHAEPLPLVLIGHGASGSKDEEYVVALSRSLASDFGIAAAAIDGPVHGARRADGGHDGQRSFLDFATLWSSDPEVTDRMVTDWRATLDELTALDEIAGPVGYWGLSMGTILGLPFVAAEPRISAAVLGLMGLTGPSSARIARDATKVTCPVLFLVQWSDEIFPRQGAFELFDSLASSDKSLHANPGTHGEVPNQEFAASARYLARRLGAPRRSGH